MIDPCRSLPAVDPAARGTGATTTGSRRPAAFLDRDGTLIVEQNYLADPAGVDLLPGTVAALRALRDAGYILIVVTNQSGIARGLIEPEQYAAVRRRLDELLAEAGVYLDGVYHCPHHPDHTGSCECRKPGTALYRRAAAEHSLDLARSIYIGDRESDIRPALDLGGRGYLVQTGYGAGEAARVGSGVCVVADLAAAVREVLSERGVQGSENAS